MGTITGMSPTTGDTVGVAFGAEWICAATIDHPQGGGIEGTITLALQSFEWALDPDGDPGTVDDMPDVISNSWGIPHAYRPECDETYYAAIDNCEAAGEVVVFAAGNEDTDGLRSPAARAETIYTTFSVAALDVSDPQNPSVAYFSSRGPSHCTTDPILQIKPDISAPGVNIYSSVPGGGYEDGWSGTSMACPHIAGVVALMRSANPELDVTTIKQIIFDTATDIDAPGDDNNTGMGMINAYPPFWPAWKVSATWREPSPTPATATPCRRTSPSRAERR
jgi:bacillopeptidase F